MKCESYAQKHKLLGPPNYYQIFTNNEHDDAILDISQEMEALIEDLSNTKDPVLLTLLNNFPFLSVKAHKSLFDKRWLNLLFGDHIPRRLISMAEYLALQSPVRQRFKTDNKNSCELQERIRNNNL